MSGLRAPPRREASVCLSPSPVLGQRVFSLFPSPLVWCPLYPPRSAPGPWGGDQPWWLGSKAGERWLGVSGCSPPGRAAAVPSAEPGLQHVLAGLELSACPLLLVCFQRLSGSFDRGVSKNGWECLPPREGQDGQGMLSPEPLDVKKIMKVTAWKARNELCDLWS